VPQSRGYLVIQEYQSITKIEVDTITCNHCERIILLHDRDGNIIPEPAGFCRCCMKTICLDCNKVQLVTVGCTPMEKKIEQIEARGRFLKSIGLSE